MSLTKSWAVSKKVCNLSFPSAWVKHLKRKKLISISINSQNLSRQEMIKSLNKLKRKLNFLKNKSNSTNLSLINNNKRKQILKTNCNPQKTNLNFSKLKPRGS